MSKFTLIHETPDHFVLHNGIAHFHVAKKGIDEPTTDKIRGFAQGGKTTFGDKTKKENEALMKEADSKILAKNYASGGEAEHDKKNIEELDSSMHKFLKEEESEKMAEGGKLDANARKHISEKNFAGPDRSYPIEDASHARNALARVSQHGSPELQSQVRAKVHSKYPGIEQSKDEGGQMTRSSTHSFYDDGGTVGEDTDLVKQLTTTGQAASYKNQPPPSRKPASDPQNPVPNAEAKQDAFRTNLNYAQGGSIANETQSQAIKRYADGNPATLSKGGHVHNNAGKNQIHLHFYDGAVVPTQLDKEEGSGPQQPTPLDTYVGGEPAKESPLDDYTNMADGGEASSEPMSDSAKLTQAAQDIQSGLDNQVPDQVTPSAPVDSTASQPVPPTQQISAAPKMSAPSPDQSPSLLSDFDKNLQMEKQGIQQGADAQSAGYQQTAKAIGDNVLQQKQQMDNYKIEADKLTQQNNQLFNDVASSKVDPNHFWNSKSTGGKIMASIGVLLGGVGGGLNGSNQNQALAMLQNHVQQDIEAQKSDQSNKMNLYKMGLEKYRDAQSAQQFATLQSNALLQGQLQKIAALTGNSQAQATATQMIGQIGVQNAGLRSQLAMQQAAFGAMNQPTHAGVDPSKLRLLVNAGVIPKEEVPAAMKEYGDYDKLTSVLNHTEDVFKQAGQNANYRERLSQALPFGSHLPTVFSDSKKYEALTNDWLGNITKDTEGRVTPTDVDLMRPSLPRIGDSPDVVNSKLNNIKDQIREKYSFPTLQSYKMLSPKDSAVQSSATRKKQFTEGQPK